MTIVFISFSNIPQNLDRQMTITINDQTHNVAADDLVKISELGKGAYGIVEKMKHVPSETIMAVKVKFIF